jgi:hypothetical protein
MTKYYNVYDGGGGGSGGDVKHLCTECEFRMKCG